MIYKETVMFFGTEFIHTYSDRFYIKRNGDEYADAYDPANLGRTYTEGELMPPEEQPDRTEEEQALTRYANSITGASDPDLISAAETLLTERIKEDM